jgi:tRNA 5-methylaminomethyl-2-thiouridine biosynthesis bifunctional protein
LTKITSANIYVNENNTPASKEFDDVYFSIANGAEETDYVFIAGNDLESRWRASSAPSFCIGETGFGTGLNFFRTIQYFQHFRQEYPEHPLTKLIFISSEKHPLNKKDAALIHTQWRQEDFLRLEGSNSNSINIMNVCHDFLAQYPLPIEGLHRRHFSLKSTTCNGEVVLDLHYADATNSLAEIQHSESGVVDAWFLDGFAPSKNDSMWTQELYVQMAKLSKHNASFATFTAAGAVKRGLRSAGFTVSKRKGFGRKREMLVGTFSNTCLANIDETQTSSLAVKKIVALDKRQAPYFVRTGLGFTEKEITIVGNGLAGALVALKLCKQGKKVRLLWQGEIPADCASGNPIGGFYPQLNVQHNISSQIQLHSFLYASEFYKSLQKESPFNHDWCGALQIAFNDNTQARLQKLDEVNLWPIELAHKVDPELASAIANVDIPYSCLHIPSAGWIAPPSLITACLNTADKTGLLSLQNNTKLISYDSNDSNNIRLQVRLLESSQETTLDTGALVLAMGSDSEALCKHVVPLRVTRGQVEMISGEQALADNSEFAQLRTLLCHKGYFTPAVNGFHALGSTYVKDDKLCDVRAKETDANFTMHTQSMQAASWQNELKGARAYSGNFSRAAIRCSSPDHLPVVGAMPSTLQFDELSDLYKALPLAHYPQVSSDKNVFILTGLGSRGLTTAPLMAEILVCQMLGQAMPLHKSLLDALQTNRFIVRSLIRRELW